MVTHPLQPLVINDKKLKKMNKIIFITSLFLTMLFPKAQQVPIETDLNNVTNGTQYKDFNNKFNKYVGTWTAVVGNKQVKLVIEKKMNFPKIYYIKMNLPSIHYYSDALLMRYEVKVNGQVVESTLGVIDNEVNLISSAPAYYDNEINFGYNGILCGVGWGWIYLTYIDATHLKWYYYVQTVQLSSETCPDLQTAQNLDINLPYEPENIIFTKQ